MGKSVAAISRAVYRHGVEALASSMFVIILCLSWLQVFRRYALDNPATWTEEVARVLLVWMAFLAAAAATRDEGHLGVDILTCRLSGRLQHLFKSFINVLVAVVGMALCWQGAVIVELAYPDHSTSLGFSRSFFYLPAMVGGGLIVVYACVNACRHFKKYAQPRARRQSDCIDCTSA